LIDVSAVTSAALLLIFFMLARKEKWKVGGQGARSAASWRALRIAKMMPEKRLMIAQPVAPAQEQACPLRR
jgi:hypothetical protein